jgi:hypothetical protein
MTKARGRKVDQFTLDGTYIATFNSIILITWQLVKMCEDYLSSPKASSGNTPKHLLVSK